MSASVAIERRANASPRLKARAAGAFYLLTFLSGGLVLFARGGLVVNGDAAATATNILAHEPLFRLGFAADLIVVAAYVAVTALFYELFKPVNRSVSLLAACFSLVGCAIQASACFFQLAPLVVLGNARYLSVFNADQLQALALLSLKLGAQAFNIPFAFFGCYCLLIGYLILQSTFLPRILGALMIFGGCGWLTFLSPPLAAYLFPYILAPGVLGEASLTLWLLVMGVNVQRWKEQASAAEEWRS
jgi:Domain of unknown function (DUF4386)